ncbi:MAG: serine/threonine protein kinase, partial [Myxococcales bacterium]|nr:serine/threonine protein kinase [Myxococcales bacterium]
MEGGRAVRPVCDLGRRHVVGKFLAHARQCARARCQRQPRSRAPPRWTRPGSTPRIPPVHEQFGRYILLERIAIGGMAEIFQAKAPGLGGFEKILAIKRLHPRYSQDADFIEMLIDEARITVELSHSNIGQIFDLGKVDEHYYIAMEYIDGRDLYRVLKRLRDRGERMPIDAAAYVAMEACAGLDYAHRKKDGRGRPLHIVHRDVSPQNVLLSFEGEVKIVDFGIAKAALRAYETEAGIIKGKFYYMSPEQARGEPLDHRTDIFSIGVVLYEMLTGELLYKDDDELTLLSRVRRADIAPPSTARPEVPPSLERIVMRALARERGDRFPSAQHMQRELARFLRESEVAFNKARLGQLMGSLFFEEAHHPHASNALRDRHEIGPDARSVIAAAARFDDGEDETSLEAGLSGTGQILTGGDLLVIGTGDVQLIDEPDTRGDVGPGRGGEHFDDSVELLDSLAEDDFFDDEPTRAYEGDRMRDEAEAVASAQGWSGQPAYAAPVAQPVVAQPVAQPVIARPA